MVPIIVSFVLHIVFIVARLHAFNVKMATICKQVLAILVQFYILHASFVIRFNVFNANQDFICHLQVQPVSNAIFLVVKFAHQMVSLVSPVKICIIYQVLYAITVKVWILVA